MRKYLLLIIVAAVIISFDITCAGSDDTVEALVQTQPLSRHEFDVTLSCYGVVSIDPSKLVSVNFAYGGRIERLYVSQGEVVKKDFPLLQFRTSPEDSVNHAQASSQVDFASGELQRVKNLAEQQLATKSQLAEAQKNLLDAEAVLAAQQKLGTDREYRLMKAPFTGVVTVLNIAQGDRVQAGATALQLARLDSMRVVLGIEPEDASKVSKGMTVTMNPVFTGSTKVIGKIGKKHGMIDPQTRLINLIVDIPPKQAARLVPGTRVHGLITLRGYAGIAVPRQSILKDDQGNYIFVVRSSLAHRINVKTEAESGGLIGITGEFMQSDKIVLTGNYELNEGMRVREAAK